MLKDLFGDILNGWVAATHEQFSSHPLASKLRKQLRDEVESKLLEHGVKFTVKASAGAGNWANVPWISMLSPQKTSSTQEGIYPVYLLRADGSGFYLSLGFGTTKLKEIYGATKAKEESKRIASRIHSAFPEILDWGASEIDLKASTDLGKSYEWGSAGAIFYDSKNIPSDEVLLKDLYNLIDIYNNIPDNFMDGVDENNVMSSALNSNSITLALPKPFLLLAGISGTGKTRFVKKQAASADNYCLVPVRPDWHEPSDLLGYVSRLSGKPEYVMTKVLGFIISAWRAIAPGANKEGFGALDYTALPYWLCLDEMNLAPVEQYFADYLSVLESREFNDGIYSCEALLDASVLKDLHENGGNIQKELGLTANDDLWQYFLNHGISIPPNLIVAGTVNMDETTHGFSRKVIDRALTIDFGEFFPNDYAGFFEPLTRPKTFSYPTVVQARKSDLSATFDTDGEKSIAFLDAINGILGQTPFELAYRALNELLLQIVCFKPETEAHLQAVWDDFLMTKVLPRIDGDEDKLRYIKDDTVLTILEALSNLLEVQLGEIWNSTRLDYYREKVNGSDLEGISCRSKAKLGWMQDRLNANTFTSFWP